MALAPVTGSATNGVSAASLALPSINTTTGRIQWIGVCLGATSSSVTSITDTGGGSPSITLVAALNVSNIRVELWKATGVATKTGNVFTINVSPNTTIAGAVEEYSGGTTVGNSATNSSAGSVNAFQNVVMQDANNYSIVVVGFAAQSGDTLTVSAGTVRQSSIPAATRPGIALYDNTAVANETEVVMTRISASREWATVGAELRSGGASTPLTDFAATTSPSLFQFNTRTGTGVYLNFKDYPQLAGVSDNYGFAG